MFQTSVLASGSKGNCVFVHSRGTALLIDAGISVKAISEALGKLRIDISALQGILVTHEHSDHIKSVGAVSRRFHIPVYITADTLSACIHRLGKLKHGIILIKAGESFIINDLLIHPFTSPHDAVDSCNFTITLKSNPSRKLALATDVGYQSRLLTKHLKDSSTIILESNHDPQMLIEGPYEWYLKQRILSKHGHLSNADAVGVISQIVHPGLKNLILAHLSEINNLPDLAETTMRQYLSSINCACNLIVADQYKPTAMIDI